MKPIRAPSRLGFAAKHGGGAGAEEQIVQNPGVAQAERIQFMGHSKYDVEVRNREQFLFPRREPALAGLCLTFRTMAIAAGVIRDAAVIAAAGASIDVAAQRRRTAPGDGAQHAQLLIAEPGTLTVEAIGLRAE